MDMQALDIRQVNLADATDARDFVVLLDEYARDPMGGGRPLPEEIRSTVAERALAEPTFGAFVAHHGESAVGLITYLRTFSTFAAAPVLSIHDVIVRSSHRRRGIGRALLETIERHARRQGCCKLTLEVLSGNRPAQAAYRAFGFEDYQLDPSAGQGLFWQKKL